MTRQNQPGDSLRDVRLQGCAHVSAGVRGDALARVVQAILDDLHRNAGFEGDGCPAVSQGVECDLLQRRIRILGSSSAVKATASSPSETASNPTTSTSLGVKPPPSAPPPPA